MGLASVGSFGVILQAMEDFPLDTRLHQEAIKALFNIMYCKKNLPLALDMGVIAMVSHSMKSHADDETVQSLSCRLFWYVCRDHPNGKGALQEGKALGAIAAVLDNFDNDTEAYFLAYQAMAAFLANEDSSLNDLKP
jgi:hypothetical protein